jgi:hypothetical protein
MVLDCCKISFGRVFKATFSSLFKSLTPRLICEQKLFPHFYIPSRKFNYYTENQIFIRSFFSIVKNHSNKGRWQSSVGSVPGYRTGGQKFESWRLPMFHWSALYSNPRLMVKYQIIYVSNGFGTSTSLRLRINVIEMTHIN